MDLLREFSQLVKFLKEQVRTLLATIVSRALQPQNGRIPCLVDRNPEVFFNLPPTLTFYLVLDDVEIIVNEISF